MNKTRQIIIDNEKKFEDFQYYLDIIDEIEKHVITMPDITIESCKALIEGVSKTILKKTSTYIDNGTNSDSPNKLLKEAINVLSGHSNIDSEFTYTAVAFVFRMSKIRNDRGDISHGKSVPKVESSDPYLSELVACITDSITYYILNIFFNMDWSYLDEIKYDDNGEFNEFLDTETELDGVLYSKALFEQDPVSYKEQLNNYLSDKEGETQDNSLIEY